MARRCVWSSPVLWARTGQRRFAHAQVGQQRGSQRLPRRSPLLLLGFTAVASGAYLARHYSWFGEDGTDPFTYRDLPVLAVNAIASSPSEQFDPADIPTHRHICARSPSTDHPEDRSEGVAGNDDAVARERQRFSIYSFYVKEPSLQIERPYTPIEMMARRDPHMLDLVTKRYGDGEMSRYLHTLRPGKMIGMRGPEYTWKLAPSAPIPKEIVMVSPRPRHSLTPSDCRWHRCRHRASAPDQSARRGPRWQSAVGFRYSRCYAD